jgi:hypothetical protein
MIIEFEDKRNKKRSEEEVDMIIRRLNNVLNEFDYEISYLGNPDEFFRQLRERYEKIKS